VIVVKLRKPYRLALNQGAPIEERPFRQMQRPDERFTGFAEPSPELRRS
jgi:hypothetical protein